MKKKNLLFILTFFSILLFNCNFFAGNASNTAVIIQDIKVNISTVKARKIAIAHSKEPEKDTKMIKLILKKEKRKYFYEIKFITDEKRYQYFIDADTGSILSNKVEKREKPKKKFNIFDIFKFPTF